MTKLFNFNWKIPVPQSLLDGCVIDVWDEVCNGLVQCTVDSIV